MPAETTTLFAAGIALLPAAAAIGLALGLWWRSGVEDDGFGLSKLLKLLSLALIGGGLAASALGGAGFDLARRWCALQPAQVWHGQQPLTEALVGCAALHGTALAELFAPAPILLGLLGTAVALSCATAVVLTGTTGTTSGTGSARSDSGA
jgi:hypothetical protein